MKHFPRIEETQDSSDIYAVWNETGGRSTTTKANDIHAILAGLTDFSPTRMMTFVSQVERTKMMLLPHGQNSHRQHAQRHPSTACRRRSPGSLDSSVPGPEPLEDGLKVYTVTGPATEQEASSPRDIFVRSYCPAKVKLVHNDPFQLQSGSAQSIFVTKLPPLSKIVIEHEHELNDSRTIVRQNESPSRLLGKSHWCSGYDEQRRCYLAFSCSLGTLPALASITDFTSQRKNKHPWRGQSSG